MTCRAFRLRRLQFSTFYYQNSLKYWLVSLRKTHTGGTPSAVSGPTYEQLALTLQQQALKQVRKSTIKIFDFVRECTALVD